MFCCWQDLYDYLLTRQNEDKSLNTLSDKNLDE